MEELSEFFEDYGLSLATRLRDIDHIPARPAFVYVEDMGDAKEVLSITANGKIEAGRNLLVWEGFVEDLDTGGRDNYHTMLKASVAVIQKATDKGTIRRVHGQTRNVVLKAFALMLQDAYIGPLADQNIQVSVRQVPLEKITALGGTWYGYGLMFTWTVPLDLTHDPADLL